jgi:hypothetical protein
MVFVNHPVEEPEKSLRDYTSPQCEDIKVQESNSKLQATNYEIKSKIIKMSEATPFEGMATENPYRHIRHSRRYATRCVKKEFPMIGSNGISFPTHLPVMQRCDNRLLPLKLKAIGTS